MTKRCRWCAQFVRADTPMTTRTVQGVRDDVLAWRTFSQLLCVHCASAWSTDLPWNRAALPTETPTVLK
jgi:hypothetical protein